MPFGTAAAAADATNNERAYFILNCSTVTWKIRHSEASALMKRKRDTYTCSGEHKLYCEMQYMYLAENMVISWFNLLGWNNLGMDH